MTQPDPPEMACAAHPSGYQRLNPLTKLTLAVAAVLEVTLLGNAWASIGVFLGAIVLPSLWARCTRSVISSAAILSLPIGLSALLIHGLLSDSGQSTSPTPGALRLTSEGLVRGLEVWMRLLVYAGTAALFSLTTTANQLQRDLERRRLPARFAYLISAAISALPATLRRARLVSAAQQARGLRMRGPLSRLMALRPIVAAVLLSTLHDAEQRALMLEMRGLGAVTHRTLLRTPVDSPWQAAARAALVAIVTLSFLVSLITHG